MRPLDLLNLAQIWLRSYPETRRIWRGKSRVPGDPVVINYGMKAVPGPDEHVFGGLVKLQDLNEVFPHATDDPNLLYLVSSALPYFPERMAQMAKGSGAKLVINQNGVAYPGWFGSGWKKQNSPMRSLHSLADHVLYQSKFCKESADQFLGPRDSDFEILYNPVNTEYFSPKISLESSPEKAEKGPTSLLLAGSHWTSYRPLVAVEVVQMLVREGHYDVVLQIAGRFCWDKDPREAEKQVMEYAASCGVADRVQFTGPYRQNEAVELFRNNSILLHTKYNDPCPRLVVEAMACGLPIVYSASGGVPELVGSSAGVGVIGPLSWEKDYPPRADDLATAVTDVISNIEQYSHAARTRAVERFDVKPWIRHHGELFTKLLA